MAGAAAADLRGAADRAPARNDGESPTPAWMNIGDTDLACVEQGHEKAIAVSA